MVLSTRLERRVVKSERRPGRIPTLRYGSICLEYLLCCSKGLDFHVVSIEALVSVNTRLVCLQRLYCLLSIEGRETSHTLLLLPASHHLPSPLSSPRSTVRRCETSQKKHRGAKEPKNHKTAGQGVSILHRKSHPTSRLCSPFPKSPARSQRSGSQGLKTFFASKIGRLDVIVVRIEELNCIVILPL